MKLFWPSATVRDLSLITQGFGERPEVYAKFGQPGHRGIDIGFPENTPIRCVVPLEGTVVQVDRHGVGPLGVYIVIEHEACDEYPEGLWSLYAHLRRKKVHWGNRVSPGQHIGLSGNTGNSTGPHLHLGIKNLACREDKWGGYFDFRNMLTLDDTEIPVEVYVPHSPAVREMYGLDTEGKPADRWVQPPGAKGRFVGANYMDVSDAQKASDRAAMNENAPARPDLPMSPVTKGPMHALKELGKVTENDSAPVAATKHVVRESVQWIRPLLIALPMLGALCGSDVQCERLLKGLETAAETAVGDSLAPPVAIPEATPVPTFTPTPTMAFVASDDRERVTILSRTNLRNEPRIRRGNVSISVDEDVLAWIEPRKEHKDGNGYLWYEITAAINGRNYTRWVREDRIQSNNG